MSKRSIFRWKAILMLGIVIVGGLSIASTIRVTSGLDRLDRANDTLQSLEPIFLDVKGGAFSNIRFVKGSLSGVEEELGTAKNELTPFIQVSSLFGWVPRIGSRMESANDMLGLGRDLVSAGNDLIDAIDAVLAPDSTPAGVLPEGTRLNEEVLRVLGDQGPRFRSAEIHIDSAETRLDRLEARALPADFRRLTDYARRVMPVIRKVALAGTAFGESWETFLGFRGPQSYLIVAQNSDELRATGGFIPGAWLLTLDHGEIKQLTFWDTVEVDDLSAGPPLPPEGLLRSLWAGVWLFRDASWNPNGPDSARVIEQIFKLGQGISVDGVVTLDQWAVRDLIGALGPMVLATGEIVDRDTYIPLLERGTDLEGRQFMDTVLQSLLDRLSRGSSGEDMVAVMGALSQGLEQKHMFLFPHDSALQTMARENGWDGALENQPGDYLMVVDSNVGFSKVNRNVAELIHYDVSLEPEGVSEGRLEIFYTNNSSSTSQDSCAVQAVGRSGSTYEEQKHACYWDYLRVYLPQGAVLQDSTPLPMPDGALYRRLGYNDIEDTLRVYSESGKAVVAGLFNVEIGSSRRLSFAYDLPSSVLKDSSGNLVYTLLIQKQGGTFGTPAVVNVHVPDGYRLRRASPYPVSASVEGAQFRLDLDSDQTIRVVLERGSGIGLLDGALVSGKTAAGEGPAGEEEVAFASVVIRPREPAAQPDNIRVSPSRVTVTPGQRILFTAVALDSDGRPIESGQFEWSVGNAAAGTVTPTGLFTASSILGTYSNVVLASIRSGPSTLTAMATVEVASQSEVETRRIDSVIAYPSEVTTQPGQTVGLGALGWDDEGRSVPNLQTRWGMTDPVAGQVDQFGFFTAGLTPGNFPNAIEVVATQSTPLGPRMRRTHVSVVINDTARRGVLSQVVVVPDRVVLLAGRQTEFVAKAFDELGEEVTNVSFRWHVKEPSAGTADSTGRFFAGAKPGHYVDALEVEAIQPTLEGDVRASSAATIAVELPAQDSKLSAAQLSPSTITLRSGQPFIFRAYGVDEYGEPVPAQAEWSVANSMAGSLDRFGLFRAGSDPGIYQDAIKVKFTAQVNGSQSVAESYATVKISGALERIEIQPAELALEAGRSFRLRAVGYDALGLEVPLSRVRWSVENPRAGTVDGTGLFTASLEVGEHPNVIKVVAMGQD